MTPGSQTDEATSPKCPSQSPTSGRQCISSIVLRREESWALKNWCFWTVALEETLESPLDCKEIQPVHSKGDQSWVFFGRIDAKAETPVLWPPHAELTHWKRLWCWEGLGAGGEGDNRGWDGWMASLTQWTWVWVNSGSWWWTGRPGVLRFMGSQRVGHDWVTELIWTEGERILDSECLSLKPGSIVFKTLPIARFLILLSLTLPISKTEIILVLHHWFAGIK